MALTTVDAKMVKRGNAAIEKWVFSRFPKEDLPAVEKRASANGEAYVVSWPILGIEKYLGMWDKDNRLPFFPSLKLTNDSYSTYMYARFDPSLPEDRIIFDGKPAEGKELKRFSKIIGKFRDITGVQTHVEIISKHIPKVESVRGKGLGLSASASGAAATALLAAAGYENLTNNNRFLSILARSLSGSGTSSAAGGFSVWFGFEGIKQEDSYAVSIDDGKWLDLVVIPIPYEGFKTESGHEAAMSSPYYKMWAESKAENMLDVMDAIEKKDITRVGLHIEKDAYMLSMLMLTGGNYLNLMPQSLAIIKKVAEMRREQGVKAYCTADTGPSIVILTPRGEGKKVMDSLKQSFPELTIYLAESAGRPKVLKGAEIADARKKLKM